MKERPILFSGPMVRAILDGRKTQTRRPVASLRHPYGHLLGPQGVAKEFIAKTEAIRCPIGQPGDRLWVRETWAPHADIPGSAIYRCDRGGDYQDTVTPNFRWRPSIHMPRWASRITLEITRVWVERVQDITDEDAFKEGAPTMTGCLDDSCVMSFRQGFYDLWQSIYGTWDANPFVWAVEFRRAK